MFDFCCLLYFKPPPRPVARSLRGSCALVGEGACNNAGQQKSHLARQSVLFFPPSRSWVWLGWEEGILCVDVSLGRVPLLFLRLLGCHCDDAACRSHLPSTLRLYICRPYVHKAHRNTSYRVPASAKKTAIGADMACEEYNFPAPQISMLAWDDGRSLARMAVFFADESIRRSRRSNIELWGRGGACCVGAKSRWLFFSADTGLGAAMCKSV